MYSTLLRYFTAQLLFMEGGNDKYCSFINSNIYHNFQFRADQDSINVQKNGLIALFFISVRKEFFISVKSILIFY